MNSLRKHPVLCSVVIWACVMNTITIIAVLASPNDYGTVERFLIASLGILTTVTGFALKWAGKE